MGVLLALPPRAAALPLALARTDSGAWLALAQDSAGVCAWRALVVSRPDILSERIPLIAVAGPAPLSANGPIASASYCLDGTDRLHLAWGNADGGWYARCAIGRLTDRAAWQGPTGGPAPEAIGHGVLPAACALARGAHPVVAGTRGGTVVALRFDGEWQETLFGETGCRPALARAPGRVLHLVYAGPDGVYHRESADGSHWTPREVALAGRVDAGPVLALAGDRPVVAAVVDGKAVVAGRGESDWAWAVLSPAPDGAPHLPSLGSDRHGTAWCAWVSGGWVRAARWLGGGLGPAFAVASAAGEMLAEQSSPDSVADLGLVQMGNSDPQVLRLPVPGMAAADDRPVRFLDLLEVARLEGIEREMPGPVCTGILPPPAPGELLPGGIAATDRDGKGLRAWFSRREGDHWLGQTAEWTRGRWGKPQPLRLSSPKAWLQPPSGALAVIRDDDEPDAARRYKMAAERAGSAPALLASGDGIAWSYQGELPSIRPFSLLRDSLAVAERRWKVYGAAGDSRALSLFTSPDRQHWYPRAPPMPGSDTNDAVLWIEDGMVLGLVEGGRRLVAGRAGGQLVPAAALLLPPGSEEARVFAPPVWWDGHPRLFLATPEGWRWAEVEPGRWTGLRAAGDRPGVCVTVPILLAGSVDRGLWVDVRAGRPGGGRYRPGGGRYRPGGVRVDALGPDGQPLTGYTARIGRGDGWQSMSWSGGKGLWRVNLAAVSLRFTIEPGACLYGFRFAD